MWRARICGRALRLHTARLLTFSARAESSLIRSPMRSSKIPPAGCLRPGLGDLPTGRLGVPLITSRRCERSVEGTARTASRKRWPQRKRPGLYAASAFPHSAPWPSHATHAAVRRDRRSVTIGPCLNRSRSGSVFPRTPARELRAHAVHFVLSHPHGWLTPASRANRLIVSCSSRNFRSRFARARHRSEQC